jgi:glycosyltransferase involved in cell wall biosynthesis
VCCYIGRISYEKSIELAFEAFDAIRKRRSKSIFVVVGDGVMLNELKATYGTREDIQFTGKLTGQILCEHYSSSDLYLFPSTFETFGNTVFESMASGTPVVGFSYAALQEFIKDGISGVLADYDLGKVLERTINDDKVEQSNSFVKAALRAVDSPLKEMGTRAREVVVNRFSPKRFIRDFLSNIDRVITQQGTGQ